MAVVSNINEVNCYVTESMKTLYGDKLAKIVLYGSYARGDFDEESDVDYLVILNEEQVSPAKEVYKISPIMSRFGLDTSIYVSAFAVAEKQYKESSRPFFKEVRKDAIIIYER
ncbi:hypothetical protein GCM10023187_28330 [Nibrella viscosa]|uniref:Polymerase nucleotidyl transferase domain-containing protein n=1 Tax=Nibrella viscosa TaxID=1084524 RepID=A0ABP8KJH3_9BACT